LDKTLAKMKILHTSDWHLGRTLYGKKRYLEFQNFLNWMLQTIIEEQADILLIAGDIFDTTTPSHKSQELYYQFLCKVAVTTKCQHVVIIGGNHDSPTLLNAPRTILQQLKIHVVGNITHNIEDELLVLTDLANNPMAIICAVPYLRDSDIRSVTDNESQQDKNRQLVAGIEEHYTRIYDLALQKRHHLNTNVPIIGLGHLFTSGGVAGDGVRELYIGNLAYFNANKFPANIDYMALGHLHVPQKVNNQEHMRYSGSPIAMGFGEANQQKNILSIEFDNDNSKKISVIPIPIFQKLARISGTFDELAQQLAKLILSTESIWVEVNYTGNEIIPNLQQQLHDITSNSNVELIKVYNRQFIEQILINSDNNPTIELQDLSLTQVFEKCLQVHEIPLVQQQMLKDCYAQIIATCTTDDIGHQA
jgi:exonuclease SbcD